MKKATEEIVRPAMDRPLPFPFLFFDFDKPMPLKIQPQQAAERLCAVGSCYANWEQGRTEPNIEMLRRLSVIFNVSIDEMIKEDYT